MTTQAAMDGVVRPDQWLTGLPPKRLVEPPGAGSITRGSNRTSDMFPETQLAFLVFGTGHVVDIPDPAFPDGSHLGPIDRALSLVGVGRIRNLPFAFQTGFNRTFIQM